MTAVAAGAYAYVFYAGRGVAVIDTTGGTLLWWFDDLGSQGSIRVAGIVVGDDELLAVGSWKQGHALLRLRPVLEANF